MDLLQRELYNSSSPIYKSTNWRVISSFLRHKGIYLSKTEILQHLEKQNFSDIKYKNESLRKASELGKQHATRGKFFSNLQADVMFLSSKRHYGTPLKYILVVICELSRYLFLELCPSLKFKDQEKAWTNIINCLKSVRPEAKIYVVTTDGGSEFSSKNMQQYMKKMNVKMNIVLKRAHRESRGGPAVESCIRQVRKHLEAEMMSKDKNFDFKSILTKVENTCNSEYLSSLEMSALEALQHKASYILLKSNSIRLRKR